MSYTALIRTKCGNTGRFKYESPTFFNRSMEVNSDRVIWAHLFETDSGYPVESFPKDKKIELVQPERAVEEG